MLQERLKEPEAKVGVGVSLNFTCEDALAIYHEVRARGLEVSEPQVGNGLWETNLTDPDGYRLCFASVTDAPEETRLSDLRR